MPITTKILPRVFKRGKTLIDDPAPGASVEHCLEVLALSDPSFNNAVVDAPVSEEGRLVYSIKEAVGTKG